MVEKIKLRELFTKDYTVEATVQSPETKSVVSKTSKVVKGLKFTIGVFFDGTQNNMYNTQSRMDNTYSTEIKQMGADSEEMLDDSYTNDHSNVAKLWGIYEDNRESTKDDEDALEIKFPVYVQGIGTLSEQPDEKMDIITGVGNLGVVSKVKDACKDIAEEIKEVLRFKSGIPIESIKFHVFGFSRGSAAARHFINEVNVVGHEYYLPYRPLESDLYPDKNDLRTKTIQVPISTRTAAANHNKLIRIKVNFGENTENRPTTHFNSGGYLGKMLQENGIKFPYQYKVNFAGLYDTVASTIHLVEDLTTLGIALSSSASAALVSYYKGLKLDYSGANDDERDINMHIHDKSGNKDDKRANVNKVVHIVAKDEVRANFPLTAIGFGETIELPGVHSDIGGGYTNNEGENVPFAHEDDSNIKLNQIRKKMISEGWYNDDETLKLGSHKEVIRKEASVYNKAMAINTGGAVFPPKTITHYTLYGLRKKISTAYSIIPLQIMIKKAIDFGVPFKDVTDTSDTKELHKDIEKYDFEYQLYDPNLIALKNKMDEQLSRGSKINVSWDEVNWLRKTYLHHSAHIKPLFGDIGHETFGIEELLTLGPAKGSKRVIHPNPSKN